jgi:L-ascorbate metabolism protein UlaG (beta-lactamase superfamily)
MKRATDHDTTPSDTSSSDRPTRRLRLDWSEVPRRVEPSTAEFAERGVHAGRSLAVRLVGGPTAILAGAGFRVVADPIFSPPQEDPMGLRVLRNEGGPASALARLGSIDAVLLSLRQDRDILEAIGPQLAAQSVLIVTTPEAAAVLGEKALGVAQWETVELSRKDAPALRISAVPALHPMSATRNATCPATGFVLSCENVPTTYVSGDNSSLEAPRLIAARLPRIEVALVSAGAAQLRADAENHLALTSSQVAEAGQILGARWIVPMIQDWSHFSDEAESLRDAFAAGGVTERLALPESGENILFEDG